MPTITLSVGTDTLRSFFDPIVTYEDPFRAAEALTFPNGTETIDGFRYVDFVSRGLPEGYNTVLGYFALMNPESLSLIEPDAEHTQRDG